MSTKAFELVPVLDKATLLSEIKGEPVEVSCLDSCTKNLFIGTYQGSVIHYSVDEKKQGEKIIFKPHLQGKKSIARKSISQIKYVAATDRLLVLVDGILCVLDATKIDFSATHDKLKNVQSFCLNEYEDKSNQFSRQICIATKKKLIQLYNLTSEKWIPMKDLPLPEFPLMLSMHDSVICVAVQSRFLLVNVETTKLLDLFPQENENSRSFIKHMAMGEFVLSGPSDLGIFVTSAGVSQRPPIQLKPNTFSVAFSAPYIITLSDQFITIHNILDQQQKQAVPYLRGLSLNELSDRIIVASSQDIYSLVPVPWQKQVDSLLTDLRVEEALQLAEASGRSSGLSQTQFNSIYRVLEQRAGFIEFGQFHFASAQKYFTSGTVDVREIISLFPGLLSKDSTFKRSSLHEFADINQIAHGNLSRVEEAKRFLRKFLETYHYPTDCKKDVHTALMKIYAEDSPLELVRLLQSPYHGFGADTIEYLYTYGRHHALAVYFLSQNNLDKALEIWSRLLNKQIEDETFDRLGLDYFADVLSQMNDASLIFSYAPVVLNRDSDIGAKIFCKIYDKDGGNGDKKLRPDSVIEYLLRFPNSLCLYLEHLVTTRKLQNESYHSHLAMQYLDRLLEAKKNNLADLVNRREKLQNFLRQSDRYSVNLLLGRVERDDWLLPEAAILHGKAGNDKAALHILVDQLKDYKGAEHYCIMQSEKKGRVSDKQVLFESLLALYLEKSSYDERMRLPVVDLLNNPKASFNAEKVFEIIPNDWSVAILRKFLLNSVRSSLHEGRQSKITQQIAHRDFSSAKRDLLDLQSVAISMTDNKKCEACQQPFKDCSFVHLPQGSLVHIKCYKS